MSSANISEGINTWTLFLDYSIEILKQIQLVSERNSIAEQNAHDFMAED